MSENAVLSSSATYHRLINFFGLDAGPLRLPCTYKSISDTMFYNKHNIVKLDYKDNKI